MPPIFSTLLGARPQSVNQHISVLLGLPPSCIPLIIAAKKRALEEEQAPPAAKIPKAANRHRDRGFMLNEMNLKSDSDFRAMFRMSRNGFNTLLSKIESNMRCFDSPISLTRAESSSGSSISKKARLGATLRWLAGGSFHDICTEFGIAPGTFFNDEGPLWDTIRAIDDSFIIFLPADDPVILQNIASGFAACSRNHMKHCVSAIDGWVMRTRKPTEKEVENVMAYRNYHDCWGIVILAGCDSKTRFNMWSCKSTGSTNDSLAWQFSQFKKDLESGILPMQWYVVGDEAFSNTQQFLVPWAGRGLPADKDSFNYHLSAMRQCIERAFGILTERWGIFWRPVKCAFYKWTLIARTCAKLHNFCLDQNEIKPSYRLLKDMRRKDTPRVYLNGNMNNTVRRSSNGDTRKNLTQYFNTAGIIRPVHANTRKL